MTIFNFQYENGLEKIYAEITNGLRIRSKCDWTKHREKSSIFFLNLEKSRAAQNKIKNVLKVVKEYTNQIQSNENAFWLYKNLYCEKMKSSKREIDRYLNDCSVPELYNEEI